MSKPLPPPREPKPAFLRFTAKDVALVLSSPTVVLVVLALAAAPGLVSVLVPQRTAPPQPPVQDAYAVDARPALGVVSLTTLNGLPAPDEQRQRKPPCDPDLEAEFNGYCWVPIDVRPCPPGKTWEHQGKCYQRSMRVERPRQPPTSGEPRQAGVAAP